jgi:hypothetical protein
MLQCVKNSLCGSVVRHTAECVNVYGPHMSFSNVTSCNLVDR